MDVEPTPGSVTVKVHFVDCGGDRGHDGAVDDQGLGVVSYLQMLSPVS